MKLKKFSQMARREGCLAVHHVQDEIWLGTGRGIYRAAGLPRETDSESIMAILDIPEKKAKEMKAIDANWDSESDVFGLNLHANGPNISTEAKEMMVTMFGTQIRMLLCEDGELVFYDAALLAPVADALRDHGEAINMVVRKRDDKTRYIIVYDEKYVIAAIVPLALPNEAFCNALQEVSGLCLAQLERKNHG